MRKPITFALVAAFCAAGCTPQQSTSSRAHRSAPPPSGAQGALAVAPGDPHAVDRATTASDYCVACHTWADDPNNHPVRVSYVIPASGGGYLTPPDPAVVLREGTWVECSSCHDDGSAGYPKRTVLQDMCAGCHDDKGSPNPPLVALSSPADEGTVSGQITVAATADGAVRTELWGGPSAYETTLLAAVAAGGGVTFPVDSTALANGKYVLLVRGYGASGANGCAYVTVVVSNQTSHPPADVRIQAPAPSALVRGTIQVLATTVNAEGTAELWMLPEGGVGAIVAAAPVQPDGSVAFPLDTASYADGAALLTVQVYDPWGAVATEAVGVTFDNTGPTVSLTSPRPGATVRGTTTFSATASDPNCLASVAFYVDGALLDTRTAAPYSVAWTPVRRSGAHTLAVVATDAPGNTATSAPVVVVAK
jgi:hypothetical protein